MNISPGTRADSPPVGPASLGGAERPLEQGLPLAGLPVGHRLHGEGDRVAAVALHQGGQRHAEDLFGMEF